MNSKFILSHEFMKSHPLDAARILERLPIEETAIFLKNIPASLTGNVIRLIDSEYAVQCFEYISIRGIVSIFENLPLEIASIYLRRMDTNLQMNIINSLSPEIARPINTVLSFPEGTAGALMDPRVFTLPEDVTVRESLKRLRKHPQHVIHFIYVVNREDKLVGFINIRELLLSPLNTHISAVMHTKFIPLSAKLNRQAILAHPGWYKFHALPVVDNSGRFLGVIGYRTLRSLEYESMAESQEKIVNSTGHALGELYWLAISGIINGAGSFFKDKTK